MPSKICQLAREPPSVPLASKGLGIIRDAELCLLFRGRNKRHAFAVHRLTEWYRQGVDIHARLPWLSAYMGHEDVLGTEVYLTATAELMDLASARFAARFRDAAHRT